MKSNPRFHIGEMVQPSIDNSPLGGVGRVRDISVCAGRWQYTVEPKGSGDPVSFLNEADLVSVETPLQTRRRQIEEQIAHHADQARTLANNASAALDRDHPEQAAVMAGLSAAHGLASIASTFGESSIGVEQ